MDKSVMHLVDCLAGQSKKEKKKLNFGTRLQRIQYKTRFVYCCCAGDILTGDIKVFGICGILERLGKFGYLDAHPDGMANVLVGVTKGVQYIHEIKDNVIGAFMPVTSFGVLCKNPLRSVRFNLENVIIYSNVIYRSVGQMNPCTKRVCYVC
ncbi:hypothetical protein RFI_04985 [Reticulomyxa filosa]|uniref:Translation elongation factor EFG/EF2 domain-containing protein n=1 Tax=Reticulomyxa filosa TaxID=46433 RepID=X6P3I7_RETFI|nr:hypothetical protein RFI_04985 [Reticulomyxa filosa]|eukprot:ETO32132.1 hypothetical protein RFI_04985 [Reticulomyxa filosa]